jgi:hypothetical protein
MVTDYEDFYLHVGWPDSKDRFPIQVVQSPRGETRQPVWQENKLRLPVYQNILDYLSELIAEPEQVELLGTSLYEFLFPAEVDEIFHRCRQDKAKGLRVRLRVDPEELSLLPWEYCFDPETRQFLALERQTPIVRYIAETFAAPSTLSMPRPVKLLVVLAAPKDQPELNMDREESGIRQALHNVPVQLTVLRHATIEKLHDALLADEPHIMHFSGHGVVDGGVGALALENPQTGATDPLTARQMRSLLSRMGITLAVLNACETARHSTRDALMGVAQALIREEIPAVIAMQFLVSESVGLVFTRRLYEYLFRGEPLEKIVTETRVGIDINTEHDRISWGIPVLFMRARDGFLWKPESIRVGSGLDSLVTADLKSRPYGVVGQPTTTAGILMKKVHRQWVIDVLSKSIPNAERRINFIFQVDHEEYSPTESSPLAVFEEHDCSLLLLGAPGSGKTIVLCELARDLIASATQDDKQPIPVILRLATWRQASNLQLNGWITEQLKTQYGLGQTHIDEITPRGMTLLLDGLDEIRPEDQASCVAAINEYVTQQGWFNLVVTCRESDYADLAAAGHRLTIPGEQVIRLAPLESTRINAFLSGLDRVGVDVTHLYTLLENECTPLMTDVILQTYEGRPADQLRSIKSTEIWGKYVERKFEDEAARRMLTGSDPPYPPALTMKWLSWLARQLNMHTQDQHRFFVEEIQPNWLSKTGNLFCNSLAFLFLFCASYLSVRFVFQVGLPVYYGQVGVQSYLNDYQRISVPFGALWMTLMIWIVARRSDSFFGPLAMGLITALAFGSMIWIPYQEMPILALIGGILTGIVLGFLTRFVVKILGFCDKQIVCVKRKKWSWSKAAAGIVVGLAFTMIVSVVSDITRAMFLEELAFWPAIQKTASFNTVVWWNWGLPGLLSLSAFFFIVLGLGWGEVVLRKEVDLPNQGIKDSGRNGLLVAMGGIVAGLIFSMALVTPCTFGRGMDASGVNCAGISLEVFISGLKLGIGYGLILSLIFGLIFGGFAWLLHYLVRTLLYLQEKLIPWRFVKFLQYASKLHLLRGVGGGFEFIDQELAAYFKQQEPC